VRKVKVEKNMKQLFQLIGKKKNQYSYSMEDNQVESSIFGSDLMRLQIQSHGNPVLDEATPLSLFLPFSKQL